MLLIEAPMQNAYTNVALATKTCKLFGDRVKTHKGGVSL